MDLAGRLAAARRAGARGEVDAAVLLGARQPRRGPRDARRRCRRRCPRRSSRRGGSCATARSCSRRRVRRASAWWSRPARSSAGWRCKEEIVPSAPRRRPIAIVARGRGARPLDAARGRGLRRRASSRSSRSSLRRDPRGRRRPRPRALATDAGSGRGRTRASARARDRRRAGVRPRTGGRDAVRREEER